jgi:hypothetical protein
MLNDSWAGRNPTKGCSADRKKNITRAFYTKGYVSIAEQTDLQ